MIDTDIWQVVLAGMVLAALVGGAGWSLYTGLALRVRARAGERDNARLWALVRAAPARAMVVRADGQVELSSHLADWLGLQAPARDVTGLSAGEEGLVREDRDALAHAIDVAAKAGRGFRLPVRAQGSARLMLAVGERAPDALGATGGVLVWFFDATEMQGEVARLADRAQRLEDAYTALTGLIEAAPMPMWYRGHDLRLAMVNTAYVHAVDASDGEDVVARQVELIERSALGGPMAQAAIARDTGAPQVSAMPTTIAGARRMLRVHDVPLADGGTAGFAIDIEELEQARSGIKRFGQAQRAMLDRISAGVVQFGPDRAMVFCNQPFRRMFAMRSEWLADRPEFDRVIERMREAGRLPEVRDFPGWKAERREWFRSAEASIEENWHLAGGTHLRVVAQPLPDRGLLIIFEDRTEQVQLASARDTLLRVRTATTENLFEAVGVFAADGRLQLWNNKFRTVWGFSTLLLATHPRVDALAREAAHRLAKPERAMLIAELVRSATADRLQRGGRVAFADGRHFEFAAVPLPDGNALLTMLDISDSKRIEQALRDRNEALEAADEVKTQFVANMSYELRTPLTSIKGFAEMLHAGYAGPLSESGTGYTAAILESVERLGTLVDDVLDLTQGDAPPVRERIDLKPAAEAVAAGLAAAAADKAIDFAVEAQESAGVVTGDVRRIGQAIEHVLRHALAETPPGGRILLHVDGTDEGARIVVSDDGPGMDAKAQARAFDRFARHGFNGSGERALGLGLPLAKQFVEAHGGTISLVSEPGQGTLVTIALPRT
ncbi:sensor histidine kinase [Sphingomonas qomolangmaensis]|uniref:histidine kinase n=1 Tax=Sphingomonas qomolangmaensis TaxID=2918765 RepID=A0ABY5LCV0_9SPHN|nr:PAS domain-containing sensor histidine kinase [Sphingomonas qomolangmaensis]UUL83614.1 PAS-domain containing protein [Sphingomonas qomolangmaensis]